jgi:arsenite methyltransferase
MSYFELHAYMGTTKHMGGLESTHELIDLCQVNGDSFVLEVGSGVGATACYLAKKHGCRVTGIDLREAMVARSLERAKREGVEGTVEFRVANAQDLPFEDALFDVVLCESVATFIKDKRQVVSELVRVTKPGGCVGLNEEIWLKVPPEVVVEAAKAVWEIDAEILTADAWRELLEDAGLRDLSERIYSLDPRREASQLRRYHLKDILLMVWRILFLYVKSPAFRTYLKGRRRLPRNVFEYLGYGLFAGRR